ncbi:MAG: hypothetical protein ABH835_04375 [Patescibacteria group bacterium]|nr:hypothetical protein [Patescibacteria group bacterium]
MNFPTSHPDWMWLYFGFFAILGMILFILVIWTWMKAYKLSRGPLRTTAIWSAFGYMFIFFGQWFACGIGAPPGNLLSSDISTHNTLYASVTAALSIFFSIPGWACILLAQKKTLQFFDKK